MRSVLLALACFVVGALAQSNILQPVTNMQAVTLTARAPDNTLGTTVNTAPPVPKAKPASFPAPILGPNGMEERWYTRAQLQGACGMPPCQDNSHCFGNPGGFMGNPYKDRPDGSHHQYCCAMGSVVDPLSDNTKLGPAVEKCYANRTAPGYGWCVDGDQ